MVALAILSLLDVRATPFPVADGDISALLRWCEWAEFCD